MRGWARRLQRFCRLPSAERRLVLRAVAVHAGVRLKLWRHGLQASDSLLSRLSREQPQMRYGLDPDRIARLVTSALRERPLRGNCLSESITLWLLLRRSGHDCFLRIGARRSTTGLEAHAWVEMDGVPLNDLADISQQFPPFPASSLPSAGRVV
ncbi:MAG: lasso peptide biosynthesis B2 protein [Vicinamibacterales bacterium]